MNCPNCGREVDERMGFCPGCNGRLLYRKPIDRPEPRKPEPGTNRPFRPDGVPAGKRPENNSAPVYRHPQHRSGKHTDTKPANKRPTVVNKSHFRLFIAIGMVLFLTGCIAAATFMTLMIEPDGKLLMAQWGWSIASNDDYVTLAQTYFNSGRNSNALEKLEYVLSRDPGSVDALMLKAQILTETDRVDEARAIYEDLIYHIAPGYPNAYRNLIKIYQQQGYYAESIALMRLADEKTIGTTDFQIMLKEYTPKAPSFNLNEGRYNTEIDVIIQIPEGETVYYSVDGTDPSEAGMVYEPGTRIHVDEGKMTVKAIGFTDNGTPSEQVTANYTVIIPTPAAPKSNYQSGVYKKAPKITLRPGSEDKNENKEIAHIYYTMDGREATEESTEYKEPIQLPTGNTTVRAIAVTYAGKRSYEMKVTYSVEGNLKKMFGSADTFKNMELFKTGYNSFVKNWGAPKSYQLLPAEDWYDPAMESYEAVYDWGTARFVTKPGGSTVLYALDTTNTKMSGPRATRVGSDSTLVLDKFRDLGQAALDEKGNRLLYNWNSGGYQFGTFRCESDGQYAIHYYYPVDEKHTIFVELSYYLAQDGKVSRIVWQRYLSEL